MATERQTAAARRNLDKARKAQAERRNGLSSPRPSPGVTTRRENQLSDTEFAFTKERKEPLVDAKHVRNTIARFDQVEGVTDSERDETSRRIRSAAHRYGVEVSASSWRDLFKGGKAEKSR